MEANLQVSFVSVVRKSDTKLCTCWKPSYCLPALAEDDDSARCGRDTLGRPAAGRWIACRAVQIRGRYFVHADHFTSELKDMIQVLRIEKERSPGRAFPTTEKPGKRKLRAAKISASVSPDQCNEHEERAGRHASNDLGKSLKTVQQIFNGVRMDQSGFSQHRRIQLFVHDFDFKGWSNHRHRARRSHAGKSNVHR